MMKLFAKIFLLVIMTSCEDYSIFNGKRIYRVKLVFEPDFYHESYIDAIEFSKAIISEASSNFNGLPNHVGHRFFKVEEGELKITAVSKFESHYSKTMNINSDTTIIFRKIDFPVLFNESDKWEDDLNLKEIDTMVIYSFNSSCVTNDNFASTRKISCFKNDSSYLVRYSNLPRGSANNLQSYKTKKLDFRFTIALKTFYSDKRKHSETKNISINISTSNAFMHIRVGNKIYITRDPQFTIGKHYDTLIAKIND